MGYKLLAATAIGDAEQVGKLIDNYPHLDINFYNHFRCCALHYAAFNNCIEVAKVLISSGAKIDCLDAELCTPMHYAGLSPNSLIHKKLTLETLKFYFCSCKKELLVMLEIRAD